MRFALIDAAARGPGDRRAPTRPVLPQALCLSPDRPPRMRLPSSATADRPSA